MNYDILKNYSVVVSLGVRVIQKDDIPPYKSVEFPYTKCQFTEEGRVKEWQKPALIIKPMKQSYQSLVEFGRDVDITMISFIQNHKDMMTLSHNPVRMEGDLHRPIAAIEECNAEFEGWIVPKEFKWKNILGYPAEQMDIDSIIGGMWSDGILLITGFTQLKDKIEIWWGIGIRHPSAFVVLK